MSDWLNRVCDAAGAKHRKAVDQSVQQYQARHQVPPVLTPKQHRWWAKHYFHLSLIHLYRSIR